MSSSPDSQPPIVGELSQSLAKALKPTKLAAFASVATAVSTFLYALVTVAIGFITYWAYQGSNRQQEFLESQGELARQATQASKQQAESAQKQAALYAEQIKVFRELELA